MRPGVLGPQRSRGVRELDFYHQVQLRRQHLPAAQDAHHGGAQQHVRVAALVHRAGDAGVVVVDFVEALHGLVAALQQVVHGHGAAVVVDVVAALAKTWTRWTKQAGLGVAGASGLVPSVFLTRKCRWSAGCGRPERLWGRTSSASWGSTARHAAP